MSDVARQRVGLRLPRQDDAGDVPSSSRRRPLWRACAARHAQPWWHATRTGNAAPGRFDLELPRGTAYWALSPSAAIIEATTDPDQEEPSVLSIDALQRLAVWRAEDVPGARSRLADTTRASVPTLTAELATVVPYTLPWAWADAFDADGRHGVLYRARFALDDAVALFGPAGVPEVAPAAVRGPASGHYDELPPGFRSGVGTVGDLGTLPRAPAP